MTEAELIEKMALYMLVAEYGEGSTPETLPNCWANMLYKARAALAAIREAVGEDFRGTLAIVTATASPLKGDA